MSIRYFCRTIPVSMRICNYCLKPILRNIARDKEGRLFHCHCLQTAKDERYRCLECFAKFDGTEAAFEMEEISYNDEFQERKRAVCPHCGSMNLKADSK